LNEPKHLSNLKSTYSEVDK